MALYPRRVSNYDGAPLTGYGGPQRVYDDGTAPSRGPIDDGSNDSDFAPTGYDRMYRAPSKAGTPGHMLDPITHAAPALPSGQSVAPADPSHFSWSGSPYAGGGQSGSPEQFGNNFIGMQAYLNGNRSPGLTNQSFDQFAAGPSGSYSKTENALDSSLYGFYGVKDTRPQATAAAAPATPSPDTPAAPVAQDPAANAEAEARDTNFTAMRKGLGNRQQRG